MDDADRDRLPSAVSAVPILSSDVTADATPAAVDEFLPPKGRTGVGLALSGGGSRAALFHLGAVRRLNEVGILSRVDTISSVSGGSILAAHLAKTMTPWPAPGSTFARFDDLIAGPFEDFCRRNIRTAPVAKRILFPWNWPREPTQVAALASLFDRYLNGSRLAELPATGPRFVFCASDNAFGINWTMSRERVGSYLAGYAQTPSDWTVGRAVAASACFPPVFDPMPIDLDPALFHDSDYEGPRETYEKLIGGLRLSDGGLYDNLALEPIWKNKEVVIASDGGGTFDAEADKGLFWRVKRYTTIMGRQATALRKRWLIASFIKKVMAGAYFGIGGDVANYQTGGRGYPPDLVHSLIAEVRTDLDAFSKEEAQVLENHGYLLADAAITRHLSKVVPVGAEPPKVPYEDAMKPEFVASALKDSARRELPFGRGPWLKYLFAG